VIYSQQRANPNELYLAHRVCQIPVLQRLMFKGAAIIMGRSEKSPRAKAEIPPVQPPILTPPANIDFEHINISQ